MSSDRIIAVTGATGRQGGAVAQHLLAGGWQVRALTRTPENEPARKLAALGAEVIRADMADPRTLTDAFRDVYGVYSVQNTMISGAEAEIRQARTLLTLRRKPAFTMSCTALRDWGCRARVCRRGSRSWR